MSGLVLKLAPKERVLINGAVIENGDRRSRLSIVSPNVNILRLKDAIHPDEATTPVRRVCYVAQLVLTGDVAPEEATRDLSRGIGQLKSVFTDSESRACLEDAESSLAQSRFYQVLKALRQLLGREDALLALQR
jgi:flagellar protein FlbT